MSHSAIVKLSVVGDGDRAPDVDAVVRELRELYCVTGLKLAVAIGKLILDRIYGGDIALWHSRGRKDHSFRSLARHPALPFAPSTLSRSVGVYEISLRRRDLLGLPNLTSSHVEELLKLPSERQDRLIDQTSRHEWSVRRLRDEVDRVQGAMPRLTKRVRAPRFARYLEALERGIEQAVLLHEVEQIQRLTTAETERLLRIARSLHQQSERVIEYLGRHLVALREASAKDAKHR